MTLPTIREKGRRAARRLTAALCLLLVVSVFAVNGAAGRDWPVAPGDGNLVAAGHKVTGFDVVPAALEAAAAKGVQTKASAAEAIEGAEAVITMLPAGEHVRAVYLGADGLVAAAGTLCDNVSAAGPPAHALGGIHGKVLAGTGIRGRNVMARSQGTR